MKEDVLLVFVKNAVPGKVKTRLAATVGNEKAMAVYLQLVAHTSKVIRSLPCDRIIFYSDKTEENYKWNNTDQIQVQQGFDLGERMMNAFAFAFKNKYQKAVIIGTDCPELTTVIIRKAFKVLDETDITIGPAADGGYYLLGMKKQQPVLFKNIPWSTSEVLNKTIQHCEENNLTYTLLPVLHDVDEESDLPYMKSIL